MSTVSPPAGTGSTLQGARTGHDAQIPFSPANPNTEGFLLRPPPPPPRLNPAAEVFRSAVAGTHPRPDGFGTLWLKERQLREPSQPEGMTFRMGKGNTWQGV